jgi:hypothetical protein
MCTATQYTSERCVGGWPEVLRQHTAGMASLNALAERHLVRRHSGCALHRGVGKWLPAMRLTYHSVPWARSRSNRRMTPPQVRSLPRCTRYRRGLRPGRHRDAQAASSYRCRFRRLVQDGHLPRRWRHHRLTRDNHSAADGLHPRCYTGVDNILAGKPGKGYTACLSLVSWSEHPYRALTLPRSARVGLP